MELGKKDRRIQEKEVLTEDRYSRIKKWTFERFVLAHFFLLFLFSFVVGIVFLHTIYSYWDQVAEEVDLNKVLSDLGIDRLASFVPMDTVVEDILSRVLGVPNNSSSPVTLV